MSRYVMAIDATKCINCKACVVACQQRNGVPYGQHRNWIKEVPDPSAPSGRRFQPGACMHCDNPLCVDACPTHATYKNKDGSVQIDAERCIGCGSCIAACPYDARYKNPITGTADKCDYCRRHSAPGQEPACVHTCPTHCRVFGDADNPDDPVSKLLKTYPTMHVMAKNIDTKPTLTYVKSTQPLDWPREAEVPLPLKTMELAATGVKWVGGLALFGVIGVFLKQLVLPSDREHGPEPHDTPTQTASKDPGKAPEQSSGQNQGGRS